MSSLINRISSLFSSKAPPPCTNDRWTFGPFSIESFPGFVYRSGQAPAVYTDANGSAILITVQVLNKTPPPAEAARLIERAEQHAQSVFEQSATKHGRAFAAMAPRTLGSGDLLFSSVVETNDGGHLLQFALVSPTANLAIFTVEGNGFSPEVIDEFLARAKSARFAA